MANLTQKLESRLREDGNLATLVGKVEAIEDMVKGMARLSTVFRTTTTYVESRDDKNNLCFLSVYSTTCVK